MKTKTLKIVPTGANSYPNLEACCDGAISIEALERFRWAMAEYDRFMDGMAALLAPREDHD